MLIQKQKIISGIILILFFLNVLTWLAVYNISQPQFLEVTFFDVGQGDAIFIETPQRQQILIDGGPTSLILEKLNKEMPFWDRTIDLIILSHPEHDHLGGLIEVLKRYKIENILWTGVLRDTAEFQEWQRLIKEEKDKEGAKIKITQAPQKILFNFRSPDLRQFIDILYPSENLEGKGFQNTNNTSLIVKLVFGKNFFLFTGDVYKSVEKDLLEEGIDIDSDVLKVGHHGSKTSSDEEFIKEVSPEIAIIQVGENNQYGHPHQETLDTLRKYGINIFRTDEDGDIKILCNSQSLKLKSKD